MSDRFNSIPNSLEAYLNMKHLAAYLLLGLGGNTSPSADDVKGVLGSVGIDADEDRLDKLIEELKGKDLQEVCSARVSKISSTTPNPKSQLIAEGSNKLASVPSGGGGGGGGGGAAAPAAAGGAEAADDDKPAAKEEEKDESDEDMGFGLFD